MTAVLRHLWAATLLLAALAGLLSPRQSEASALTCPAGQVVWLRGSAAPALPLLLRFAGRVVGGGVAGPDGMWALPLTVRERPGIYPVAVERRDAATLVAAFTCFVDLPFHATPTSSPTSLPSHSPSPTRSDEVGSTQPRPQTTPTATLEALAATPTPGQLPSPTTPTVPCPEASRVCTRTPDTPATLAVLGVQPHDPANAELFEYVVLANPGPLPQDLAGWAIVHGATGEAFSLPVFTLPPGEVLLIWSGAGVDDPATGTLFWPAEAGRWATGDQVLLRNPHGQTVSSLTVPQAAPDAASDLPRPDAAGQPLTTLI